MTVKVIWEKESGKELPAEVQRLVSPALQENIIRIEKCNCGSERAIWKGDEQDAWKWHFDSGEHHGNRAR